MGAFARGARGVQFDSGVLSCRFEQHLTQELTGSEDAREAARAFVEQRKPVFMGR